MHPPNEEIVLEAEVKEDLKGVFPPEAESNPLKDLVSSINP